MGDAGTDDNGLKYHNINSTRELMWIDSTYCRHTGPIDKLRYVKYKITNIVSRFPSLPVSAVRQIPPLTQTKSASRGQQRSGGQMWIGAALVFRDPGRIVVQIRDLAGMKTGQHVPDNPGNHAGFHAIEAI